MYRNDRMIRVLDIAILGLLMDRDHHGYEIRTQLRERLGAELRGLLAPSGTTALLVTHDHDLIDEVATRLWHFEEHGIEDFQGPYSEWKGKHN